MSDRWDLLVKAVDLEHDSDWGVVEVGPWGVKLLDPGERLTEEVLYFKAATDALPSEWPVPIEYVDWGAHIEVCEPANIITPGWVSYLFEDDLDAGSTIRFQAVILDTYDCDECAGDTENDGGQCDHTFGWGLVWYVAP